MANWIKYLILALAATAASSGWAAAAGPKVIITVSLSKSTLTIQKMTHTGERKLLAPIVPIVSGSLRTGSYEPRELALRYRTPHGTGELQNVVRFGRDSTIRTSRMFDGWVSSRRPTTHSVVLEPATGKILFDTVKAYGISHTIIRIVR